MRIPSRGQNPIEAECHANRVIWLRELVGPAIAWHGEGFSQRTLTPCLDWEQAHGKEGS